MCGFLGIIKSTLSDEAIDSASEYIKYRGSKPVQVTRYKKSVFCHTRLPIIDISEDSNQPFENEDAIMVYNGEVYNYKILSEKFFNGKYNKSDTQLLFNGLQTFGSTFLEYVEGPFSIAFFSKKNNTLFLAIDSSQERPLYYSIQSRNIIFASNLKSIMALGGENQLDFAALGLYFSGNIRHIPAPFSIIKGISKMLPGEIRIFDTKNTSIVNQKILAPKSSLNVEQSVISSSESDVKMGLLLSGGIDSSYIASILKNKITDAFSFKSPYNSIDIEAAQIVAAKMNLKHHILELKQDLLHDELSLLNKNISEPVALFPMVYIGLICRELKSKGIKVLFSGNGGDELFHGYDGQKALSILSLIPFSSPILAILKSKTSPNIFHSKFSHYQRLIKSNKILKTQESYENFIKSWQPILGTEKHFVNYSNLFGYYIENSHSLTLAGDVSGLSHNIEIRNPLMTSGVLNSSKNMKFYQKTLYNTKMPLRNSLKRDGIGIVKKKSGFGTVFTEGKLLQTYFMGEFTRLKRSKINSVLENDLDLSLIGKKHEELTSIDVRYFFLALWIEENWSLLKR